MASPLLSERVCASILRSLCVDDGKWHGKKVVGCLEKQLLLINIAGEEARFSFADAVDVAHYDARGMLDDFFPRYPYKTTRNSWKYFKTWVTEGTGQLYKEFCLEWIDLAQLFLRKCSSCRSCATGSPLLNSFCICLVHSGPTTYIGERPRYMYHDDDRVVLESELYPVAGGLVVEEAGPVVKEEFPDAPPGFAWPMTNFEIGGPSGKGDAQSKETQLVTYSDSEDYQDAAESQERGDPMLLNPAVTQLTSLPGSSNKY